MTAPSRLEPYELVLTVRPVRGYRYLDRCGETVIRLEEGLHEGWSAADLSPKSGTMRNELIGMTLAFDSSVVQVSQSEYIDFETFFDQSCRILDIVRDSLTLRHIVAPVFRVTLERSFVEAAEAETWLDRLDLCPVKPDVIQATGGAQSAFRFVLVTGEQLELAGVSISRRRRVAANVVTRVETPQVDSRIMTRAELLPRHQREVRAAIMRMREKHRVAPTTAVQFELEETLENSQDFDAGLFDFQQFVRNAWQWTESMRTFLSERASSRKG